MSLRNKLGTGFAALAVSAVPFAMSASSAAACTNVPSAASPGPATSCTIITETVTGGNYTLTAPANVTATGTTLNGTDQSSTYSVALATGDNTGSGAGWNETISQSVFTNVGATHTIGGVAQVSAVAEVPGPGTSTAPTGTQPTLPLTVPDETGTPVVFQTAAIGSGLGNFVVTPTVTFAVPASTYADTYTATAEVDLTAGP